MRFRTFLVLFFLLAAPSWLLAQNATLTGTVKDATEAVIPGATITARSIATNNTRTVQTNDAGVYSLPNLAPGLYEVTVEKAGFSPVRYSDLTLTVSQILTLDPQLDVGAVVEVVEVSGEAVTQIDLETAQLSNLVDERRIKELPLITRNVYELVLLSPGTLQSNTRLGGFSVNGARERNNNFLLDGTDNNDTSVPGIAGGVSTLNPDATQEFRVITNSYLPEYGRNTGGVIDIITKSGTNQFHGTAYWFGRWDETAARDFFNHDVDPGTGAIVEEPPFIRNQFGGSIGGPVIKDKTFWFFNYEGNRFRSNAVSTSVVPTEAFKTGVFNFVDSAGNVFPIDLNPGSPNNLFNLSADPVMQQLLGTLPEPNAEDFGDGRGNFRFVQKSATRSDNYTIKVDHNFNSRHTLSGRYAYNLFEDPNPFFLEEFPGIGGVSTDNRSHNLTLAYTATLTPTLVNEFRWGGNRIEAPFDCTGTETINQFSPADSFGRGFDFIFSNFGLWADFGCNELVADGQARATGTYTYKDNLTWVKGSHTFKFGAEMRFIYENGFSSFFTRPNLTFDAEVFGTNQGFGVNAIDIDPATAGVQTGSLLLQAAAWAYYGIPDFVQQTQFFNSAGNRTGDDLLGIRQREFAFFLQDSWKVTPRLTLNYGVRYQWNGVPFEVDANFPVLLGQDPSGPGPFTFEFAGPGTGKQLFDDDYNNWEPRIGLAWDPFGTGKTAIRAGYAITHDRLFGNLVGNLTQGNPPFTQTFVDFPVDTVSGLTAPPSLTPVATVFNVFDAFIFPSGFEENFEMPEAQQWNVGIQHEVLPNTIVDVNYVGTKGTRLFRSVDGNAPRPELVAQLVAFCSDPANAFGCAVADLQFRTLQFGAELGAIPFNAVNNNAFNGFFLNTSQAKSAYHGLQVNLTKRMSRGFQIQGAYTWAHAIDNASDPIDPAAGNRAFPRDTFNLEGERGNSDFDVRQRLVVNWIWELPLGRGRSYASQGAVGRILEGWQFQGVATFSDGIPFDIFSPVDSNHNTVGDRPDLVGDASIPGDAARNQIGPLASAFDNAPFGRVGNLGRNRFTNHGINNFDVAVSKMTSLTETVQLEFRTEFFNLFNRVQFGPVLSNNISDPTTFGQSFTQQGRPDGTSGARQVQFALKLHF